MKVLVTGATGMLGSSISRYFSTRGHELCGLSRGKLLRAPFPKEHLLQGDVTEKASLQEILRSVRPDVVIHSAALTDVDFCEKFPEEAFRVNGEGTRHIAEFSERFGAIFCYISSDYVFDGESSRPYREEDPCNPINAYGKSKWLGEEHARTLAGRYYIVRTSWLFGENRDSFVHHVLHWAETKKEIRLVEDKWGIPSYTPDLAMSIHLLLEKKAPWGVYHITNGGEGCNWLEYGRQVLVSSGLSGGISLLPMRLADLGLLARRPLRTVLSYEKFLRTTQGTLRFWQEALKEYLITVKTLGVS